jgi:haloacetate dehalogenase
VERLAVLDIIPTGEVFRLADHRFALSFWPWSLLAQPEPLPEQLVLARPEVIVNDAFENWGSQPSSFPAEVRAAYVEALRNPQTVHAVCEDYRAAATIDRDQDRRDQAAGRRIRCPVLVLWSDNSALDIWYEAEAGPIGIWRRWAVDVTGRSLAGGHFFPEQNPAETIEALRSFFAVPSA